MHLFFNFNAELHIDSAAILVYDYLNSLARGAFCYEQQKAEIITLEPAPDNAGEGKF